MQEHKQIEESFSRKVLKKLNFFITDIVYNGSKDCIILGG